MVLFQGKKIIEDPSEEFAFFEGGSDIPLPPKRANKRRKRKIKRQEVEEDIFDVGITDQFFLIHAYWRC